MTNPIELLSTASAGQTFTQLGELSLALLLSTAGEVETRALHVRLRGRGGLDPLVMALGDLPGVISVNVIPPGSRSE